MRIAHLIYGTLFVLIGIVSLIALVIVVSQADDTTQTVTITNAAPTVDTVVIHENSYGSPTAASVTLTETTTKTVYVWGAASDTNGCEEIDAPADYALKFYRTDKGDSCSADNNDCYSLGAVATVDQCTVGGADTATRYQFSVPVQYFADSTDAGGPNAATTWSAKVTVTDSNAATGTRTTTTEMNSLIALDATAAINYGTLALGATSSSDQTVTITNTGNRNMDANVKADGNMTCTTIGAITVGQVKYSLSSDFVYASAGTALTTGDVNSNNSTAQRTNEGVASTTPVYFKIAIPSTGVSGVCSNTITWTAIADS